MTDEQIITLLNQVGPISEANGKILGLAQQLQEKEGVLIVQAAHKLLDACDLINQVCAEQLDKPKKKVNPAVTW